MSSHPTGHTGHTARLALPAALGLLLGAVSTARAGDLNGQIADLIDANVTGGVSGFRLKEVDGPVLASVNANDLFYPASTIKVVEHVHAMLEVEENGNGVSLGTVITVYDDPDESCADNHAGHTPTFRALDDVLRRMMEQSDNQDTNAVQEFFGRPAINASAHDIVGLSQGTQLFHKFGCGGPNNDPANQFPLVDATLLYEQVALGNVFDLESTRQDFYELMLDGNWFDDLMDEEAPEGMDFVDLADFKSEVRMARKSGNIGSSYLSTAGWIQLPAHPCSGQPDRGLVFAVFFDDIDDIDPGFGPRTVAKEMLRDEVRNALQAWQQCAACGSGGPCDQTHTAAGCDDEDCCSLVCEADSLCCQISWDAPCVGLAIDLCGLAAANDDCADAVPITNGVTGFSISNSTNDGPGHIDECNWNPVFTKDVWFDYTAECTGYLSVSACGNTPFSTWIGVYADCDCPQGQLDLLGCAAADAFCGGEDPGVDGIFVTSGECYKIRVAAGNPTQGTGFISIECEALWDDCEGAFFLGEFTGSINIDTNGATTDGPAHGQCSNAGDDQVNQDVWYDWIAPCTGTLTVDTCGSADFDTRLAVYAGWDCPASENDLLGCNDDATGCAGFTSELSVLVFEGEAYKLRVGGYQNAEGTGQLNIACDAAPANDNCEDASLTFLGPPTPFTTVNSTTDGIHHADCGSQILRDVWFRRTATCTGFMTVTTCDSADFDTKIAVYDGCECPATDEALLACNDQGPCGDDGSSVTIPVMEGQCYLVRIGAPPLPVASPGEPPAETGSGTVDFICAESCTGDIVLDGVVDVQDLVELLVNWGPCPDPCPPCPADTDDDCQVGVSDLVNLIVNWGPCNPV